MPYHAQERVEGARRRGDAHEEAPEDDEHGRRAQASHLQDPARRAAAPLPQRGEREAAGAHAGPGHGGPMPVDQEGQPLGAAARRHVRPCQDVLLGHHPPPPLLPQPQIRHCNPPPPPAIILIQFGQPTHLQTPISLPKKPNPTAPRTQSNTWNSIKNPPSLSLSLY